MLRLPPFLHVTWQLASITVFSFLAFVCIGLPLAVVPGFVHDTLGYSTVIAGISIGIQYFSTLLSRPLAGRLADSWGGKRSVSTGLLGIFVSGLLALAATSLSHQAHLSLVILLISRILLGVTQGMIGVAVISWGIHKLGSDETARVISWNGIAAYGGMAAGAPLGVWAASHWGLLSMGSALMLLSLLGLLMLWRMAAPPVINGVRMSFRSVLGKMTPFGLGLALASIGFGTLTTFITLYYSSLQWTGAAYCLSAFGGAFVLARLLFMGTIKRFGGFKVTFVCLGIEAAGLALLWLAPSPNMALVGSALAGFGLSLVYPALAVVALANIPASSRGGALSAFSVFFDLALGLAGPLMGAIAAGYGYPAIFLCSALMASTGLLLTLYLAYRAHLRL